MIHLFTINKETFGKMENVEQSMEYGLLDEKKQKLKRGDTIVFEDSTDNKQLIARVIGLYTARTFFDLRKQLFMKGLINYNSFEPKKLTEKFSKEEVDKYGVVAWNLFFDNELRVTGRKYDNYVAYEKKFVTVQNHLNFD